MKRITKTQVRERVQNLNKYYCENTLHKFTTYEAYGKIQIGLTGKQKNDKFLGLGSGFTPCSIMGSSREVLNDFNIDYALEKLQRYEEMYK